MELEKNYKWPRHFAESGRNPYNCDDKLTEFGI